MRSRVVLDHLTKSHDVQVVVSGRAYDYLQKRASEHLAVRKIWGYSIVYEDNEVPNFRTLLANLKGAVTGWPENVRAYFELADKFEPDVVISDFESWSYLFAQEPRHPGGLRRQHPDGQPLHARAGDPRRARERVPARQGGGQAQGRGRVPLPHHDVLLSAGAQEAHDAAPADPAPGDPGGGAR